MKIEIKQGHTQSTQGKHTYKVKKVKWRSVEGDVREGDHYVFCRTEAHGGEQDSQHFECAGCAQEIHTD